MRLETKAIHAGQSPEPTTGAIMPPVFQTSTFVQSSPGKHQGYEYARSQNPTREALERNIAGLEGGNHGIAFGSGCAATSTVLHMLKAGDHIVSADDVYGGTFRIFDGVFKQMGIETSFVDLTDLNRLESAMKPNTRMVWVETPTNPLLKIIDLKGLSGLAHDRGCIVTCDNTFATPILQSPLELGADLVLHSTTKFINGHSDVVGGIVVTSNDEHAEKLRYLQNAMGAVPGPWDCWLTLRGAKTMAVRVRTHDENGRAIASWLESHPKVARVIYPGLASHPQHALAKEQMRGFGGMISLVLKGGDDAAVKMLEHLKIFALAESLGGVESLAEHPGIMTHASIPPERREEIGIAAGLVRLSVGIEHIDDLRADLERGLDAA